MRYIIYIMSYNSKENTEQLYSELKKQNANVKVLENSSTEEQLFKSEDTIDLGRENIGVGGFYDYVLNNISDDIDFYGIFNNDVMGLSDNFIESIISSFKPDIGIIHPEIIGDITHPYQSKIGEIYGNNTYNFIENVLPFYNYNLLLRYKELLSEPIRQHFYGWMDKVLSNISNEMGFYNIILSGCNATHDRSGVRKSIKNNYNDYVRNSEGTYRQFLNDNPNLIKYG